MGVFRAVLKGVLFATTATRNVFTYQSADETPTAVQMANVITDMMSDTVVGVMSTGWHSDSVAIEVPTGGHWGAIDEAPCAMTGARTGDTAPQQIAYVVIGITASRRRGKKFFAGVTEEDQINGVIRPEALGALASFGALYIAPTLGIENPFTPGVCRPDGSNFIPFTGFRVDPIVGTQRRRKQGSGI